MPTMPQPPSRALVGVAIATGIFDAALWLGALTTFAVRWGDRMAGAEVRLSLTALAFGAVTAAMWTRVYQLRNRHQTWADYAQRLDHLDEGLQIVANRTARLARCLEEIQVEERPGEETGDIIHMPRPRPPYLRGVKSV